MPGNCPIREDIKVISSIYLNLILCSSSFKCENKTKKLAKQECCLKLVEVLHEKGKKFISFTKNFLF